MVDFDDIPPYPLAIVFDVENDYARQTALLFYRSAPEMSWRVMGKDGTNSPTNCPTLKLMMRNRTEEMEVTFTRSEFFNFIETCRKYCGDA